MFLNNFIAIVEKDYAERVGMKMLKELEDKNLQTLNQKYLALREGGDKQNYDNIQMHMVKLWQQYKDDVGNDQVKAALNDVQEIKLLVNDGIQKTISNLNDLEVLIIILK